MAASRSSRVTRSSVGLNGLDENFCGRTLRNRSIAQPDETSVSPLPRARSPKKRQDGKQESRQDGKQESRQDGKQESRQDGKQESRQDGKQESRQDGKQESRQDGKQESRQDGKQESRQDGKQDFKQESRQDGKQESKQDAKQDFKQESRQDSKQESRQDSKQESRQDNKQESRQDNKQESRQDSKQESRQDNKQESRQDNKQESRQDGKQESRQDCKQESRQDGKQESKPEVRQESKQDAKQDLEQESRQDDKQESKPDVRQESKLGVNHNVKQDSQQQVSLQGKLTDSIASPAEAEQWTSSRKRSVSCLDKDISPEKSENCDRGKGARDPCPQIKRAKRCSRSGDSQGQEDDPEHLKPEESPVSVVPEGNSCEEFLGQNSANTAPSPTSPVSSKKGEGEKEAEDGRLECDGAPEPPNAHKASNGLRENKAEEPSTLSAEEEPSANPTSASSGPSLLNGSQSTGAPSSPNPAVPCRNSVAVEMEVPGSGVSPPASSPSPSAPALKAVPDDPVPELIVVKEQEVVEEVEVDVVGESLCLSHEEQVMESDNDATNGQPLTPVQEASTFTASTTATPNLNCSPINNSSNSGETTPPLTTTPSPTEPECNPSIPSTPPSFTELYEHRYTLRTSPRRAANGGKASTSKLSSPPRDNGPLREEGEVEVGLEEVCPMVVEEEPSSSDCVAAAESAGGTDGGPSGGQELTQSQAAAEEEEMEEEQEEEEEEEEEPDVYYFESDHLALKHNKDYQRLLQTIGVLEAQRTQAILDLETLARQQREALAHPISFVEQLQKRVDLSLPCPQRVVQLPGIAWEQYTSGLGDFERDFCHKKRKTRQLQLIFDKGLPDRPKSPVEPKKEGESSTMYSSLPDSDSLENGAQAQMIRGRICHQNKPDTFNQLWTVEEQKKLEQCLLKFPPEEVESKRWQKIADELGNRTAKQVASRVQKYFIKLTKAGIPVPGRTPNLCMYTKKASSKRQHHLNKHLYRPSTFLTSYEPPVFMDDEDERAAYYSSLQDPSADDSDEEAIPLELRSLPEYKELLELKRLKKRTLQDIQEEKAAMAHVGYKCDVCGMEPIQGVRWHCQDCPPDNSVDFCSNCSDCLFKTETHKPSHHLEPVHQSDTFLDRDYCLPQSTGYNYLDPNYFPANR